MSVPPRFTEEAFRRYEPFITHAMNVLPSEYDIHARSSLGLSPETVSARLRDAMRSLKTYAWPTSVNMTKFLSLYDTLEVARKRSDAEIIVIRLKASRAIEPRKQLAAIEVLLNGTPKQRHATIMAAAVLAGVASDTMGQCGLGGLRLSITEADLKATVGECTYIVDGDGIILL